MRIFAHTYDKMLTWFSHHKSTPYLYILTFIEPIFFPIPPDVMLAPMCAARPRSAMKLALMTTLFSVAGGATAYLIGFFLFDQIQDWLIVSNFWDSYQQAKALIEEWGVWIILTVSFSPLPYKIFTIGAGALEQNFLLFLIASLIGRGARFFLVALLLRKFGVIMLPKIRSQIEGMGWFITVVLLIAIVIYYLTGK